MGCIGQVGPDAYNARRVALAAGLPDEHPGVHGEPSVRLGAAGDLVGGDADAVGRGGPGAGRRRRVDARMPFYDFGARSGYRLGDRAWSTDGGDPDRPVQQRAHGRDGRERCRKYGVSRLEQDEFALESQRRAATEAAKAAFAEEIVPVEVGGRKPVVVTEDEHPKPDTTLEVLARLRPGFRRGRDGDSGQRVGHQRRCRCSGAGARVRGRRSRA